MGWQREDHGVLCNYKTADGGERRALLSVTSVTLRMWSFGWRGGDVDVYYKAAETTSGF